MKGKVQSPYSARISEHLTAQEFAITFMSMTSQQLT